MADSIQPSSDPKATALAIATHLVGDGAYDAKSSKATSNRPENAKETAKIIGEIAKLLCEAVNAK